MVSIKRENIILHKKKLSTKTICISKISFYTVNFVMASYRIFKNDAFLMNDSLFSLTKDSL